MGRRRTTAVPSSGRYSSVACWIESTPRAQCLSLSLKLSKDWLSRRTLGIEWWQALGSAIVHEFSKRLDLAFQITHFATQVPNGSFGAAGPHGTGVEIVAVVGRWRSLGPASAAAHYVQLLLEVIGQLVHTRRAADFPRQPVCTLRGAACLPAASAARGPFRGELRAADPASA